MKKLFLTTALLSTALLGANTASAQITSIDDLLSQVRQERMAKVDTNADGFISQSEFMAPAMERFTKTDANADGFIDEGERKAEREARKAERETRRFDRSDVNGDGVISRDEVAARGAERSVRKDERKARFLERVDTDGDGTISDAERTAARAEMEAKRGERKADRKARKGERGQRAERVKPDANDDGFISRDEYAASVAAKFTRADKNGDGVLAAEEMNLRGHKGRKGKRKGRRGQR